MPSRGWSRTILSFRFAMPQVYAVCEGIQGAGISNCTTTAFPYTLTRMTQIVIVRSATSAVVGAGQGSPESGLLGPGKRPAEKVSMLLGLVAGVLPAVI